MKKICIFLLAFAFNCYAEADVKSASYLYQACKISKYAERDEKYYDSGDWVKGGYCLGYITGTYDMLLQLYYLSKKFGKGCYKVRNRLNIGIIRDFFITYIDNNPEKQLADSNEVLNDAIRILYTNDAECKKYWYSKDD